MINDSYLMLHIRERAKVDVLHAIYGIRKDELRQKYDRKEKREIDVKDIKAVV